MNKMVHVMIGGEFGGGRGAAAGAAVLAIGDLDNTQPVPCWFVLKLGMELLTNLKLVDNLSGVEFVGGGAGGDGGGGGGVDSGVGGSGGGVGGGRVGGGGGFVLLKTWRGNGSKF